MSHLVGVSAQNANAAKCCPTSTQKRAAHFYTSHELHFCDLRGV
jgi:hypothetical protein